MSQPDSRVGIKNPSAHSAPLTAQTGPRGDGSVPTPRDPRLVQALEEYLAAMEAGGTPDRQEFLAGHAEIAGTLAECLDGLEFIRSAASRLREPTSDRPARVAESSRELQPEGALGDFRIVREIGRGGMGVVYDAVQISLGRKVALKVLPFAAALDQKQLQRFKNEAQAAATLHHTNIVPVYAIGTDRGVHYYAMQFIEGQSLAFMIHEMRERRSQSQAGEHLETPPFAVKAPLAHAPLARDKLPETLAAECRSPAPNLQTLSTAPVAALSTQVSHQSSSYFRTVAHLGVQAAEALEHAHSLGVVHRDIKPANLLVDVRGNLWITDFGLAQVLSDSHHLTMTGDLIGTLRYMSPEQALAKRVLVDHRADIYSLGVTLYELLTLEPAFPDDDRHELIRKIAFEEPAPPQRINPRLPADLVTIVLKTIAKNPDERYSTAQELAEDLKRFLKDEPIWAKRPTLNQRVRKWARRHQPLVRAGVATLLLAVLALATSTVLIWRGKKEVDQALERGIYAAYIHRINLAERELSVNNLARAEELLGQCPATLRGWEWHYLKRQRCQSMPPLRNKATIWSAGISPNGQQIASSDVDGWIRIWDAKSGHELHSFQAFPEHASSVVFSNDGQRLACGNWLGSEEAAKVFDARTGEELAVMRSPIQRSADTVAFSPDGRFLVSGGFRGRWDEAAIGEVILWDATSGELLALMEGHGQVLNVAFSPNGRVLASGGQDKTVKLWDVQTHQQILTFGAHTRPVNCVAFSPDGRIVASGSGDWGYQASGEVKLWDAVTGREQLTLRGHFDGIESLAFSPDGRRLVTGGQDMTVKIWDVATGHELLTLRGHTDWVTSVNFAPEGHRLVSAGFDRTVRIWDGRPWQENETCQEALTLTGHEDGVNSVAYSPDGRRLVSGSADGTVRLWNAWNGSVLHTLRVTSGQVTGVAFSPDGRQVAAVTSRALENVVQVFDAESGREIQALKGAGEKYNSTCVVFSPDGRVLASAGFNFTVNLWNLTTGELMQSAKEKFLINSVAFSPDGGHLASACEDGTLRMWNAKTREAIARLEPEHVQRVVGVVFSRDGKLLVSSVWSQGVIIWQKSDDDKNWIPRHHLRDPTGAAEGVAISPDSQRVAWGSTDSTVKVWDAVTGKIQTLRGHRSWVHGVSFSPDGQHIASASQDGTVKVWELPVRRGE